MCSLRGESCARATNSKAMMPRKSLSHLSAWPLDLKLQLKPARSLAVCYGLFKIMP